MVQNFCFKFEVVLVLALDFFGTQIDKILEIVKILYELLNTNQLNFKKTYLTYMVKFFISSFKFEVVLVLALDFLETQIDKILKIVKILYELLNTYMTFMVKFEF